MPGHLFLIVIALISYSLSIAAVIGVPGEYDTIQEALDNAQTGDTVLVAPGTYPENILWPDISDLVLVSEHGPDQTIIDGDSSGTVITLLSSLVDTFTVIKGFTIKNGAAEQGGGIRCSISAPLITGNIIENCTAVQDGGGIYCVNSPVIIDGNTIRYNSAGSPLPQGTKDHTNGGAICLAGADSGMAVISDNIITDNYSFDYGGGITSTRSALITGNQIVNNQSGWFGGGIYHLGATGTVLSENLISANASLWGAGITLQGGHLTVTKCEITYNEGDGIHIYYGTLIADSSTFANNTRDGIGCGAGKVSGSRSASVHYCSFTDNDEFGIRNSNSWLSLDATLNWWGDPSGPGGEGPGTGDEVSKLVEYDPWLTQTGISGEDGTTSESAPGILVQNPVQSFTTLHIDGFGQAELHVYDLTGRIVSTLYSGFLDGSHSVGWNTSELTPGMYFLRIKDAGGVSTARIMVIR